MPSWKKVITSGSAAALSSLTVTNGITGSLFGTASWAVSSSRATTSSYALTSSYSLNPTISGSISQVDYIDFNTGSATPAWKSGRVFWDNTEGSLAVYNAEADITLNVGQENWTRVWNATGVTIHNGDPVRIAGTHGDAPQVVLAQSVAVSGSSNLVNQILGVATHDIEANTFGFITTQGLVHGLDTSAFTDGATLYVSSSAGQYTTTVPSAPYEIIPVGQVVKASPGGSGIIYVAVQQPLDFTDLSSVHLGASDYADGELWAYDGPSKSWKHTRQLSGSYGITGSVNATSFTGSLFGTSSWASNALTSSNVQGGAANYIPLWNTATSLSSSTIYQSAGNIGIQNTSSVYPLTVGTNTAGGGSDFTVQTNSNAAKVVLSSQTSNAQIGANPQGTYFNGMPPGASFGSSTAGARTTIGSTLTSSGGGTYINFSTNGANTGLHVTHNYGSDLMTVLSSGNVGLNTTTPNATLDVNGNAIVTGSLTVTNGITGSLFGTASWALNALTASFVTASNVYGPFGSNSITSASFAVSSSRAVSSSFATTSSYSNTSTSASFASTASYVNTLNQSVLITGSTTIGSSSLGASENTLTLGPSPAGGAGEGGQLGLNAVGGTYTSASFIDNWQNKFRILKGTNASSTGLIAQWDIHTTQLQLPAYTSPTAITGTVSGLLAFDTSGNIITTTTGSGGGGGVTINNNVDNYIVTATGTANTLNGESGLQYNGTSLTVTGQVTASGAITSTANGAMYFRGGDDAEFWDINVANTVGIYGQQNADRAGLKLGSSGPTLFGSASRLGIGTITPTSGTLEVSGNVYATSFTGSLFGTASWANNVTTASYALTASNIVPAITSNVDNYLLTATGTGTINGESRLTFDGTTFMVYGNTEITGSTKFKGDAYHSGSIFVTSSNQTLGQFVGNQNGYVEFSVRNTNTGISASGDIAVYADTGTTTNNYIDMGINNSGLDSAYFYGGTDFGNALDAYLYNVGGNLRIGNATSQTPFSQSLYLFSNPTATPNIWITGSQVAIGKSSGSINGTFDVNGNTTVTGSGTFKGAKNISGFDTDGNLSVIGTDGTAGASSTFTVGINVGNSTPPYVIMYKSNGGYVGTTNTLGVLQFKGTAGSTPAEGARITAVPTATWGSTSYPTALTFNTVPVNSTTQLERMRVDSTGNIGIRTTTPSASLHVAGTTLLSGSFNTATSGSILTVIGSGSTQPIFTVQGSQGELFSVTDSLSGSLFSVNDISGLPILEVFSDNTTLVGNYQAPALVTTAKNVLTNSGSFTVYSIPTASYDGAFFEYTAKSGSNARAGSIMAIWSGTSVNYTETTTTDFGTTSGLSLNVSISGSNMVLTGSAATTAWTIKTIVRSI